MSINAIFGAAVFLVGAIAFQKLGSPEPAMVCLGVACLVLLFG